MVGCKENGPRLGGDELLVEELVVGERYPCDVQRDLLASMGERTRAIHGGCGQDLSTGAVNAPIYMSSTFGVSSPGRTRGYDYTRGSNPNFEVVERQIGSLEGGEFCLVFGSGISSLAAVALDLRKGERVVSFSSSYSGTYRLLNEYLQEQLGVRAVLADIREPLDSLEALLQQETPRFLFFESPTNPLMHFCDVPAVATLCSAYGVRTVFDNTFSTPIALKPLALGVDVVVHSTTKFLNGHSDILGGCLVTNRRDIYRTALNNRLNLGMIPSPFDCFLLSRSLKSLPIRMLHHSQNAMQFATHFENHPFVNQIHYPGLKSHPSHQLAKRLFIKDNAFGGVMSIDLKVDGIRGIIEFCENLHIFSTAISLGGIESLINHSTTMTHKKIPPEIKKKIGITDTLLRVSIGLEDVEDLIQDFEQAIHASIKLYPV